MKSPCSPQSPVVLWLLPLIVSLYSFLWANTSPISAQNPSTYSSARTTDQQWQPHRNYARSWKRLRVLTWNVENLFDTLHDDGFHDEEFLPLSQRKWTSPRYWRKQGAIARTLVAAADLQPIDLIGLCEIENDSVIHHLCRRTRLARLGYEYLVTHSRDQRGVDVALLYQPFTLSLIAHQSLRVPFDSLHERPTRDILHATFRAPRGDTLDVFLAHFPSRLGGAAHSSPYRERAANLIAHTADSLLHLRLHPHLIALGDFNDEPSDPSIARVLSPYLYALTPHATPYPVPSSQEHSRKPKASRSIDTISSTTVHAKTPESFDNSSVMGTYFFRHQWNRIDQILVSHNFITEERPTSPPHDTRCAAKKNQFLTRPSCDVRIFAPSFLLECSKSGELHPHRTYLGTYYHGGISDHLPLFADFWY